MWRVVEGHRVAGLGSWGARVTCRDRYDYGCARSGSGSVTVSVERDDLMRPRGLVMKVEDAYVYVRKRKPQLSSHSHSQIQLSVDGIHRGV